ncbi:MAG: flavodoxin [Bacteroides sp.]|nr:flavodoxin [Bacteroides sp.]
MKRFTLFLALLGLIGLGSAHAQNFKAEKMLIVYYSWGGNTKAAAEIIQKETGAEMFELKTQKAYPEDYQELLKVAKSEIDTKNYPTLQAMPRNLEKYDVIFVGTPNWYSTMAPAVSEFFAKAKINDKIVVPFVTHGSGGMANCETDMQAACPSAKFLKGIAMNGSNAKNATISIQKWLKEIGMAK